MAFLKKLVKFYLAGLTNDELIEILGEIEKTKTHLTELRDYGLALHQAYRQSIYYRTKEALIRRKLKYGFRPSPKPADRDGTAAPLQEKTTGSWTT